MILCRYCAYINGLSKNLPNLISFFDDSDLDNPEVIELMETKKRSIEKGGAKLTSDYKLIPRNDSDFFDRTFQIINDESKEKVKYWIDKLVCDVCILALDDYNGLKVIDQLDEKDKLFRLFMRKYNKKI